MKSLGRQCDKEGTGHEILQRLQVLYHRPFLFVR